MGGGRVGEGVGEGGGGGGGGRGIGRIVSCGLTSKNHGTPMS